MKKNILLVVILISILGCGTTSNTLKTSKKIIKGNWELQEITYSDYGNFKITFFNDVSKDCLVGSQWSFVPNNNSGYYNILNESCPKGERNFIFSIQEVDPETGLYDFLLKPTDDKKKSIDNKGFRLRLAQLSDKSMQWQQSTSIDGKTFKIKMNFIKNME